MNQRKTNGLKSVISRNVNDGTFDEDDLLHLGLYCLDRAGHNPAMIPMVLHCPRCHEQHIDRDTWATPERSHRTHLCSCGHTWKPANVPTAGVEKLGGA